MDGYGVDVERRVRGEWVWVARRELEEKHVNGQLLRVVFAGGTVVSDSGSR